MPYDFRSELESTVGKVSDQTYIEVKKMAIDDLVRNDHCRLIQVQTALTPSAGGNDIRGTRDQLLAAAIIAHKLLSR